MILIFCFYFNSKCFEHELLLEFSKLVINFYVEPCHAYPVTSRLASKNCLVEISENKTKGEGSMRFIKLVYQTHLPARRSLDARKIQTLLLDLNVFVLSPGSILCNMYINKGDKTHQIGK